MFDLTISKPVKIMSDLFERNSGIHTMSPQEESRNLEEGSDLLVIMTTLY